MAIHRCQIVRENHLFPHPLNCSIRIQSKDPATLRRFAFSGGGSGGFRVAERVGEGAITREMQMPRRINTAWPRRKLSAGCICRRGRELSGKFAMGESGVGRWPEKRIRTSRVKEQRRKCIGMLTDCLWEIVLFLFSRMGEPRSGEKYQPTSAITKYNWAIWFFTRRRSCGFLRKF